MCCCRMLLFPWHCRAKVTAAADAAGVAAAVGGWSGQMNSSKSAAGLPLNIKQVYRLRMCRTTCELRLQGTLWMCLNHEVGCRKGLLHAGMYHICVVPAMRCCAWLTRRLPTKQWELHMTLKPALQTSVRDSKLLLQVRCHAVVANLA